MPQQSPSWRWYQKLKGVLCQSPSQDSFTSRQGLWLYPWLGMILPLGKPTVSLCYQLTKKILPSLFHWCSTHVISTSSALQHLSEISAKWLTGQPHLSLSTAIHWMLGLWQRQCIFPQSSFADLVPMMTPTSTPRYYSLPVSHLCECTETMKKKGSSSGHLCSHTSHSFFPFAGDFRLWLVRRSWVGRSISHSLLFIEGRGENSETLI